MAKAFALVAIHASSAIAIQKSSWDRRFHLVRQDEANATYQQISTHGSCRDANGNEPSRWCKFADLTADACRATCTAQAACSNYAWASGEWCCLYGQGVGDPGAWVWTQASGGDTAITQANSQTQYVCFVKEAPPPRAEPIPIPLAPSRTAGPNYLAAEEYGPNYLAKDDVVPSWYGLQCEDWCLFGWNASRCDFSNCSGCLTTLEGESACRIPKYASGKKNVLLLMVDDLTVDPETQKYGHPQSHTPNIEKLAESGTRFELAYTAHPICMPSRAAVLTGIYGINSFNMFTEKYYENPLLSKSRTFVEMFKLNGYYTVGTGKIGDYEKPDMFKLWGYDPNYGPFWRTNGTLLAHPTMQEPLASSYGFIDGSFGRLSEAKDYITDMNGTDLSKSGWTYGIKMCTPDKQRPMRYVSDDDRDPTPDEMNADFAVEQLANNSLMKNASWLMAVGFIRPHTPLHAPDKYFDYFPLEDLKVEDTDIQGNSTRSHFISERGGDMYDKLVESYGHNRGLKLITQAYLACTYAVDDQIGRVLTALEESPFSNKTIVVLLSDHGWHNGYKQVLWKNTPWEPSTRIPLIIKDPDYIPNRVQFPVSSIDLYPTLLDLAELEITNTLIEADGHIPDGYTLTRFMKNASFDSFEREGAISIIPENVDEYTGNTSRLQWNPKVFTMTVRMKDYRYILVSNGTEELYDNVADPYEMTNLLYGTGVNTTSKHEMKQTAIGVLNSELAELEFGTLDAEVDPKICLATLWTNC